MKKKNFKLLERMIGPNIHMIILKHLYPQNIEDKTQIVLRIYPTNKNLMCSQKYLSYSSKTNQHLALNQLTANSYRSSAN